MAPPLSPLPSLDQLPLREGDPPNSAWGLWGDGPDSALGSLNYLGEELVLKTAREEIRTGERVGLKYDLHHNPGRFGYHEAAGTDSRQSSPRLFRPTIPGKSRLRAEDC